MRLEFLVHQQENGLFLRDFLRLKRVSSGLCTAIKQDRGFFCNDTEIHTNARVHTGDRICFWLPPEKNTNVQPQDIPLSVLYEDEHAMVLDKPPGQTVHPTRGYKADTLANAFYGEMDKRKSSTLFRPVNRIDRGTSGMVLCAMNAYAAPILAANCKKVYYAVVEGSVPRKSGIIDAPIAHCPDSIIKRQVAADGKPSCTEYEVLGTKNGFSLIRCIPITGRTHQIRVHFSWLGYPLAGDSFYGAKVHFGRPALHCGELTFSVFNEVRVRLPLPQDMQLFVDGMSVRQAENWLFKEKVIVNDL
ncbi:RluA family pseudouridine synthase [uncultured Ruthenibacterium sp.]|uniref:RluA family pseudouridine synthase n=1 Tax=uncultured Ruthenibacterium sp. TaxID=1905347 RepID=UPI00349E9295